MGRSSRRTRQRDTLLSVLRENGGHMDAYSLYLQAREKEDRLNLSTVYRGLRAFMRQGLVQQRIFDGVHRSYETGNHVEHHHLLCLGCGAVVELSPVIGSDEEKLLLQLTVEVVSIEVTLKGYCPKCRSQRSADAPPLLAADLREGCIPACPERAPLECALQYSPRRRT